MNLSVFGVKIHVSVLFCAMIAFLLLIDQSGMMTAAISAAVIHELGHLSYMLIKNLRPRRIEMYPACIKIVRDPAPCGYKSEIALALSGPLLNLICCVAALVVYKIIYADFWVLVIGAVNLALGGFQLLPIIGLDGGDVLKCLLLQVLPIKTAGIVCAVTSVVLIAAAVLAGVYLLVSDYGNPTLVLAALYLAALLIIKVKSN
ncbi:MAG TPA: hypothetical protein DEQ02_01990 [Ruminococcaceae bacterium]|nr:hypothetical protein [Oscillospiraceae bacterium]